MNSNHNETSPLLNKKNHHQLRFNHSSYSSSSKLKSNHSSLKNKKIEIKPSSKTNSLEFLQNQSDQGVHQLIHRIRFDLLTLIDTPLSTEQLTSPAITFSITRPLELTYFKLNHQAIIFALLVNRVQFITDSTHALTTHSVNATRATLCEILATNVLRRVHESDLPQHSYTPPPSSSPNSKENLIRHTVTQKLTPEEEETCLLKSANVLATAFTPFEGAPFQVISSLEADWGTNDTKNLLNRRSNALEMAIVSEAKQFIRSSACQRVIEAIWCGKIVYTSTAIVDIVSDRYKYRPVSLYNPRNAPLLNHYRLTVPRNRTALDYFHYAILIASYVTTLHTRQLGMMNGFEIWFNVFTLGFAVDKLGSILEHGWLVFIANLWNGFDAVFILGHCVYLSLRIAGLVYLSHYDVKSHWLNEQSHQVLSCLAILLFPRLAFVTLSDNILILSLRSMLSDFVFLMLLGAWCFLGFGYSLYSLQRGKVEFGEASPYTLGDIAIWMVYIFFGLDATGISNAHEFHPILGPAIFIIYACLSNTLLVTVLVSILSKIFSDISNDSIAETLYRRAVLTFEGVKSDALFSFQPPFNIPAMLILIPLKPFLTPRKFHTVIVFLCRMFGCPVLLTISFFERYVVGPFDKDRKPVSDSLKLTVANSLGGLALNHFNAITKGNTTAGRKRTSMSKMSSKLSRNLSKFGGLAVINACFDYEPYPPVRNESQSHAEEDQLLIERANMKTLRQTSGTSAEAYESDDQSTNRSGTVRHNEQTAPWIEGLKDQNLQSRVHSSDLENGSRQAFDPAHLHRPLDVKVDPKLPKPSTSTLHDLTGRAPARELTTLEKLFLPHAGMVSTFVGPIPPPLIVDTPMIETPKTSSDSVNASSELTPTKPSRISSGRKVSTKAKSADSSSTIEEEESTKAKREVTRPLLTSRQSTMYLDPPQTSLGGNHKPASIIQDEFEEDRLEDRRRRRRTTGQSSTSNLSILHLSHSSSRQSLHDDQIENLNERCIDTNYEDSVAVSQNRLDRIFESRLAKFENRLMDKIQDAFKTHQDQIQFLISQSSAPSNP